MNHAQPAKVNYEPADDPVFCRLEDGKIDLYVFWSNRDETPDGLGNAIDAWHEDSAAVVIAPHFRISSPVDFMIEDHEMPAYDHAIDEKAQPVFEAIKREMLEQVARIDALVFKKIAE